MRRIMISMVLGAALCAGHAGARDERPPDRSHALPESQRVDLNHASIEELLKVPGITRVWADRIVRFRPYHSRLDLLQQGVLPAAVYKRVKDAVIVHREKK